MHSAQDGIAISSVVRGGARGYVGLNTTTHSRIFVMYARIALFSLAAAALMALTSAFKAALNAKPIPSRSDYLRQTAHR
jgi:hypothetical protein